MHRTVSVSSMLLLAALAALPALAQTEFKPRPGTPAPAPPTHPTSRAAAARERPSARVAIGESAPDFGLSKLDGKSLRLSWQRGNWVLLWFAPDRDSLPAVEHVAAALAPLGIRTFAICFDKAQAISRVVGKRELPYTPLPDPTGDIVALYGLLDPTTDEVRPGFVLVTPRGVVRLALLGQELPSDDASRLVQFAVQGTP
jgi:peroxiredoxin